MEQFEREALYAREYEPKFGNLHFHTEHPDNRLSAYERIEELIAKNNLYTGGGSDHNGYMEGFFYYEPGSPKNGSRSVPRAMFGVTEEQFRQLKERALG